MNTENKTTLTTEPAIAVERASGMERAGIDKRKIKHT